MNSTNKYSFLLTAALLMIGLLSSCLKEDFSDCPRPFRLFVKAVDADENDITESGDIKQAILFVFNEDGQIVNTVSLTAEQIKSREPVDVKLAYPGHKSLKFAVWANNGDIEFPETASVKQRTDIYAKLISDNGTAQSPDDLFFGELDVPVEFGGFEPSGDQTVIIRRKTAQVKITAINLEQWHQNNGKGVYSFRLKESPDTYDYAGMLSGDRVNYLPASAMTDGTLGTSVFRTYPTENQEPFTLEILHDGEVIYSADMNNAGVPFIPQVGRMLNIIIDFRAEIQIFVEVTPWDVVYQYVII